MSSAPVRVGIVGCGLIAQVMHLPHLRELADLYEVAAVCDLSDSLAERVAVEYGIGKRFQHWQDMLTSIRLDAVLLLSSGSHAPAAIAASQAGLHVFTEKPMCLSSIEGQAMVDAARAAGKHLMVGYMKRYDPAYAGLELRKHGVDVHVGAAVEVIERDGDRLAVLGENGERVVADLVVVATGVRPNSDLAAAAGVETGVKGAIRVDRTHGHQHPRHLRSWRLRGDLASHPPLPQLLTARDHRPQTRPGGG